MDPRAGLDDVEKRKFLTLPGLEFRPPGRPASSQSLYRIRYPGSSAFEIIISTNSHTGNMMLPEGKKVVMIRDSINKRNGSYLKYSKYGASALRLVRATWPPNWNPPYLPAFQGPTIQLPACLCRWVTAEGTEQCSRLHLL
jgi:hypothetical protein